MKSLVETNKFEVIDMPGMNTLGFLVQNVMEEGYRDNLMLEKIDNIEVEENGNIKKVFNVIASEDKQSIVLLTLTKNRAIINTGILDNEGFEVTNGNIPLLYGTIFNDSGITYKEVGYTPNLKRNFTIVDTQTFEEVKPEFYTDESTNTIKGRCKILPQRVYVVLELSKIKRVNAITCNYDGKDKINTLAFKKDIFIENNNISKENYEFEIPSKNINNEEKISDKVKTTDEEKSLEDRANESIV